MEQNEKTEESRQGNGPLWPIFLVFELFFKLGFILLFAGLMAFFVGILSYVVVSKRIHGEMVTVPLIVSENVNDALQELGTNGLYLQHLRTEYGAESPAGIIINQNPAPMTQVKKGTPVRVTLSGGPVNVGVPDLRGMDHREARSRLERTDLKSGRISSIESDSAPVGTVITTEPAPGASVALGAQINLLVSMGPSSAEISMPRITGKTIDEARDLLAPLELEIRELHPMVRTDIPENTIFEQYPPAGMRVQPGTLIKITVSQKNAVQ